MRQHELDAAALPGVVRRGDDMSLPPSFFRRAALLLACGAAPALGADAADSSVMYRCPGNDYKNTITGTVASIA